MAIDWCTRADVDAALGVLAKTHGTDPVGDDEARAWYSELARFPGAVVLAAATSFTDDRFPTRIAFIRHTEAVARDRVLANRVEQRAEQEALEVAPPVDRDMARVFVGAMREAMVTAVEPADHENHTATSSARCPVCSTKETRAALITAETQRLLRERGIVVDLGTPTYGCAECRDVGAVIVDAASMSVRPCSRCTPSGFLLWRHGHTLPGHSCKDCRGDKAKRAWLAQVVAGSQRGPDPVVEDEQIRADFA